MNNNLALPTPPDPYVEPDYCEATYSYEVAPPHFSEKPHVTAPATPEPRAESRPTTLRPGTEGHVVVAVDDPALEPEVTTIITATGREVIHCIDPRRIGDVARGAAAIIADATTALVLKGVTGIPTVVVFAEPGPINWELAMRVHASEAFVIPAQAQELLRLVGREGITPPRNSSTVVAVMGAVGGVGVSTLAGALALGQKECTLIDTCQESGGLDLLWAVEDSAGIRWNDVNFLRGDFSPRDLKQALPHAKGGQAVLTFGRSQLEPLTAQEVERAIDTLAQTGPVVVDCPSDGEIASTVLSRADSCLLVVPSEVRALARATWLVENWTTARPKIVLRHRGWSGLSAQEVERFLQCDVVAQLPQIRQLTKQVETIGLTETTAKRLRTAVQPILQAVA